MNLIVDASVAVKWFLDEEDCEAARSLLDDHRVSAPDLILLEVHNAIWKRWRRSEARLGQLENLVPLLIDAVDRLHPFAELAAEAAALSRSLRHPIYDCVYLALAARERIPLVTADHQLLKLARQQRIEARPIRAP